MCAGKKGALLDDAQRWLHPPRLVSLAKAFLGAACARVTSDGRRGVQGRTTRAAQPPLNAKLAGAIRGQSRRRRKGDRAFLGEPRKTKRRMSCPRPRAKAYICLQMLAPACSCLRM